MPQIDLPEQQILELLDQLSPSGRRQAIRRLLPMAEFLDAEAERNRPHLEDLARQRGLDWNLLTNEERERLVDDLLHE